MSEFNPRKDISDYADDVMQMVSDMLFDKNIAHDCGEACVYFNDTEKKETYRIVLEKCECYEGDNEIVKQLNEITNLILDS